MASLFSSIAENTNLSHVEGKGGMAKFNWNGSEFVLYEKEGIKANDYKKIKKVIDDNYDIIINRWNEYFNK